MITERTRRREATFYYLWRGLSWVADYTVLFAVPVLMFMETQEIASSGIALFLLWSPRVMSLMFAGAFADTWSPRTVLLISNVGRALAAMSAVVAVSVFGLSPSTAILGFAFIVGLCFEQAYVAGERIASVVADRAEQPRLHSVLTAVEQCAAILGPLVGGVLLLLEPVAFLLVFLGVYLVETGFTLVAVPRTNIPKVEGGRPVKQLVASFRIPSFRRLLVVTIGLNFVSALVIGLAPGYTGPASVHTGWLVYPGPSTEALTGVTAMSQLGVVPSVYREHVCTPDDVLAPDGGYMRGPARYCFRAERSEQVKQDMESIIASGPISTEAARAVAE